MDAFVFSDIAIWVCIIASVVTVANKVAEFTDNDSGKKDNEKGTN